MGKEKLEFGQNFIVDNKRFGTDTVLQKLKDQNPKNLTEFRANDTKESLLKTKKNFLSYISSHKDLTILVDAHGGPNGFFMSQGLPDQVNDSNQSKENPSYDNLYISADELVSAFEKRYNNGYNDVPIFLESACFSQNFMRNVYAKLISLNKEKNKNISLPISAGVSEYGQYGFSDYLSNYGSFFLGALLQNKSSTKLKDIIVLEAQEHHGSSNISLFVPVHKTEKKPGKRKTRKDIYFQIAKNNENPLDRIFALQYAESAEKGDYNSKTASYFEAAQPEKAKAIRDLMAEEGKFEDENV